MTSAMLMCGVSVARLLLTLQGAEGRSYAQLAVLLGIDAKTVKRAAHKAQREGLVAIAIDAPGRGNKARLSLTAKGQAACAQ